MEVNNMEYPAVAQRKKKCIDLYRETENIRYAMEEDCIAHLFHGGFDTYEQIADFCLEHNIDTVYDIGCAYGHQSQTYLNKDIEYVGINEHDLEFYNTDKCRFIAKHYPFKIYAPDNALAVSVMCLGWGVYLYKGTKTLRKQFESLARDFNHCLLYISNERYKCGDRKSVV